MTDNQQAAEEIVDSGMSGKTIERAEWLWANLPTGRKWTALQTHEKALVCHTLALIEAETREKAAKVAAKWGEAYAQYGKADGEDAADDICDAIRSMGGADHG